MIFNPDRFEKLNSIQEIATLGMSCLIGYFGSTTTAALMSLIYYFAKIVRIQIDELVNELAKDEITINQVGRKMLYIKASLIKINGLLGIGIFLSFLASWITLSMAVCLIAEHFGMKLFHETCSSSLNIFVLFSQSLSLQNSF